MKATGRSENTLFESLSIASADAQLKMIVLSNRVLWKGRITKRGIISEISDVNVPAFQPPRFYAQMTPKRWKMPQTLTPSKVSLSVVSIA